MKKIVVIIVLSIHSLSMSLHAMKKPTEQSSVVIKDATQAPTDVQAKANWIKDQSFDASSSAKVNDTITKNNKKLQDLHGIDSQITPTSSGSMFDPTTTFQLQDGSLDVQFASLTGKPTRSTFMQYDKKTSSTPTTKVDTQYNKDGSMKENVYKKVKNKLVQSEMIEYNKDGSFTITKYNKDGTTILDTTTFKPNLDSQPLTQVEQVSITELQPQADAYAKTKDPIQGDQLAQNVLEHVVQEKGITLSADEQNQLAQLTEKELSKVDTTKSNWFLNFYTMITDLLSKIFSRNTTFVQSDSVYQFDSTKKASIDLSSVDNVYLDDQSSTVQPSAVAAPVDQFEPSVKVDAQDSTVIDEQVQSESKEHVNLVQEPSEASNVSQESSEASADIAKSPNKKGGQGTLHYLGKRMKEVQSGQTPKIFTFQKNNKTSDSE